MLEETRKAGGTSGGLLKKTGIENLDEKLEKEKLEKEKENKTGFLVNALNNRRDALEDDSSNDESDTSWDDE